MTAAEWVIGKPFELDPDLWSVSVLERDERIASIRGRSPAECLRLAHLFRAAEAMREALTSYACAGLGINCKVKRLTDGTCLKAMTGECGDEAYRALRLATPQQEERK